MAAKSRSGGVTGDVSAISGDRHPVLSIKRCETSLVPSARPSNANKLFSFVKWDPDATYRNPNQVIAQSHSQSNASKLIDVLKLLAHTEAQNPRVGKLRR